MARLKRLLPLLIIGVFLLPFDPALAIKRSLFKEIRARYEGMTLRLRADLRPATVTTTPNVISDAGIGYVRERSPVLFRRLQKVYIGRLTNNGKQRLELTIYRSAGEADRYRALAIPPPALANPHASSTLAAFAQLDSTSVLIELQAGKKEPARQREEIDALISRLFYVEDEPTYEELVAVILQNRGATMRTLRALTGLEQKAIMRILEEAVPPGSNQSK